MASVECCKVHTQRTGPSYCVLATQPKQRFTEMVLVDYLKKQPVPLREIESAPVRQHMFGNPFKFNKSILMMDEVSGIGGVDEVQLVSPSGGAGRGVKRTADQIVAPAAPPKRRKGALPKDFEYVSPLSSPCPSPPHTE